MTTISKYHKFLLGQFDGTGVVNFSADTIKVALLTKAYVPDLADHTWFSDLTHEVSAGGYTPGGFSLVKSLTEVNGVVTFDANDVIWDDHDSGFSTARYAVLYKATGNPQTSRLIACIDFESDQSNIEAPFTIVWSPQGILTWS